MAVQIGEGATKGHEGLSVLAFTGLEQRKLCVLERPDQLGGKLELLSEPEDAADNSAEGRSGPTPQCKGRRVRMGSELLRTRHRGVL